MPPPSYRKAKRLRDTVFKLIEEVKKRRLLWDPNDNEYMDRESTAIAWQEIADILSNTGGKGIPGDIKVKWKGLRDTFRRVKRKNTHRTGRWPYMKALSFLDLVHGKSRVRVEPKTEEEYLDTDMLDDEVEESSQPYEYIKCEESSDNDQDNIAAPELELDNSVDMVEDHNLMFLKSLLPYFKSLEPMRQLIVRNKMQDILLNELAAQITNNTRPHNKTS